MTAHIQFLDEIPIDERHTLHQLLGRFQTVKDGLPELVKNAKDQYSRRGIDARRERTVVVIASSTSRRIGVLDFAGAGRPDFRHWLTWSDPDASRVGDGRDIEGRHGNGGKGFMVRGSTEVAFLESVLLGRRTKMGFQNDRDDVQYYPGYFVEKGLAVDDVPATDVTAHLEDALAGLGVTPADLPEPAREALQRRQAFTLARVDGVREWAERSDEAARERALKIPDDLVQHPQTALTIETCEVWVIVDRELVTRKPLERDLPDPLAGFERPRDYGVPEVLPDPESGDDVATGPGDRSNKRLRLRTSARSLRMPGKRPINVIRVRDARNVVASWSVADLYPHAESAYVYGELTVPALQDDHVAGADRMSLADTALVRALRDWVGERIEALCEEIQQAMAEDYDARDRRRVNRELRQFRTLMDGFLEDVGATRAIPMAGTDDAFDEDEDLLLDADEGSAGPESEGAKADRAGDEEEAPGATAAAVAGEVTRQAARQRMSAPRGRTRVVAIDLEPDREAVALAAGTRIPLVVRVTQEDEAGQRRRTRTPALEARLEGDLGVVEYEPKGAVITAREAGRATLVLRDRRTGVESEPLAVEVVRCRGARLGGDPGRPLRQGERLELEATFLTDDGERDDLMWQANLDEPEMGRVDRRGTLTAGRHAGELTVRLRWGPRPKHTVTLDLEVGEEVERERPRRALEGAGVPYILVCGTPAPGMEAYSPEQRTIQGGVHEPTIIDFEPQFEHVIWINPASEESVHVREGRGGTRGVAGIGTKSYLRFLTIKCFEILKRLYVRERVKDRLITESEFRRMFAEAEIACAPFVDEAYEVAETLARARR